VRDYTHMFPTGVEDSILKAALVCDALGAKGLTYILDQNSPYRNREKSEELIDQIQYPRDTLRSATGDCDDTTVLYCSLLENIGIKTVLLDDVEHIFMMFDTGIPMSDIKERGLDKSLFIIRNGRLWIPVETTLFKKGFAAAWNMAARLYLISDMQENITAIPVDSAWSMYPSVNLPFTDWEAEAPSEVILMTLLQKSFAAIKKKLLK